MPFQMPYTHNYGNMNDPLQKTMWGLSNRESFGGLGPNLGQPLNALTGYMTGLNDMRRNDASARHASTMRDQALWQKDNRVINQSVNNDASFRGGSLNTFKAEDGVNVKAPIPIEVEKKELLLRPEGPSYRLIQDFEYGRPHEQGGEKITAQEGDVVIPGNMREQVLKLLDNGIVKDLAAFEAIRQKLPTGPSSMREQYANGSKRVEDNDKVKAFKEKENNRIAQELENSFQKDRRFSNSFSFNQTLPQALSQYSERGGITNPETGTTFTTSYLNNPFSGRIMRSFVNGAEVPEATRLGTEALQLMGKGFQQQYGIENPLWMLNSPPNKTVEGFNDLRQNYIQMFPNADTSQTEFEEMSKGSIQPRLTGSFRKMPSYQQPPMSLYGGPEMVEVDPMIMLGRQTSNLEEIPTQQVPGVPTPQMNYNFDATQTLPLEAFVEPRNFRSGNMANDEFREVTIGNNQNQPQQQIPIGLPTRMGAVGLQTDKNGNPMQVTFPRRPLGDPYVGTPNPMDFGTPNPIDYPNGMIPGNTNPNMFGVGSEFGPKASAVRNNPNFQSSVQPMQTQPTQQLPPPQMTPFSMDQLTTVAGGQEAIENWKPTVDPADVAAAKQQRRDAWAALKPRIQNTRGGTLMDFMYAFGQDNAQNANQFNQGVWGRSAEDVMYSPQNANMYGMYPDGTSHLTNNQFLNAQKLQESYGNFKNWSDQPAGNQQTATALTNNEETDMNGRKKTSSTFFDKLGNTLLDAFKNWEQYQYGSSGIEMYKNGSDGVRGNANAQQGGGGSSTLSANQVTTQTMPGITYYQPPVQQAPVQPAPTAAIDPRHPAAQKGSYKAPSNIKAAEKVVSYGDQQALKYVDNWLKLGRTPEQILAAGIGRRDLIEGYLNQLAEKEVIPPAPSPAPAVVPQPVPAPVAPAPVVAAPPTVDQKQNSYSYSNETVKDSHNTNINTSADNNSIDNSVKKGGNTFGMFNTTRGDKTKGGKTKVDNRKSSGDVYLDRLPMKPEKKNDLTDEYRYGSSGVGMYSNGVDEVKPGTIPVGPGANVRMTQTSTTTSDNDVTNSHNTDINTSADDNSVDNRLIKGHNTVKVGNTTRGDKTKIGKTTIINNYGTGPGGGKLPVSRAKVSGLPGGGLSMVSPEYAPSQAASAEFLNYADTSDPSRRQARSATNQAASALQSVGGPAGALAASNALLQGGLQQTDINNQEAARQYEIQNQNVGIENSRIGKQEAYNAAAQDANMAARAKAEQENAARQTYNTNLGFQKADQARQARTDDMNYNIAQDQYAMAKEQMAMNRELTPMIMDLKKQELEMAKKMMEQQSAGYQGPGVTPPGTSAAPESATPPAATSSLSSEPYYPSSVYSNPDSEDSFRAGILGRMAGTSRYPQPLTGLPTPAFAYGTSYVPSYEMGSRYMTPTLLQYRRGTNCV